MLSIVAQAHGDMPSLYLLHLGRKLRVQPAMLHEHHISIKPCYGYFADYMPTMAEAGLARQNPVLRRT